MFLAALNTEIFKYVILVCAIPLWLPFFKALLAELNDSLAEEGGLFGRTPSKKELDFILRDPNRAASPLVSHEFDPSRAAREGKPQRRANANVNAAAGASRTRAPAQGARGAAPAKTGFAKPRGGRGFSRQDRAER